MFLLQRVELTEVGVLAGMMYTYTTEEQTARLVNRRAEALDKNTPELLTHSTVDGPGSQLRRAAPDMAEGNAGELASPAQ
jgi:hypothetical protein